MMRDDSRHAAQVATGPDRPQRGRLRRVLSAAKHTSICASMPSSTSTPMTLLRPSPPRSESAGTGGRSSLRGRFGGFTIVRATCLPQEKGDAW